MVLNAKTARLEQICYTRRKVIGYYIPNMPKMVFRYEVQDGAARLISDVLRSCGIMRYDTNPSIPGVQWNHPYHGFCTCGFDQAFARWRDENPHSRSCLGSACTCGVWAELERWSFGRGHSPKCGKSKPTFMIADVGLFMDPDGRVYSDHDFTPGDWQRWKNRAIAEAKGRAA